MNDFEMRIAAFEDEMTQAQFVAYRAATARLAEYYAADDGRVPAAPFTEAVHGHLD